MEGDRAAHPAGGGTSHSKTSILLWCMALFHLLALAQCDLFCAASQVYAESTDGSWIEAKESALVWHYRDADPDFGDWQSKELLDHLEGVLSNEPVEVRTAPCWQSFHFTDIIALGV